VNACVDMDTRDATTSSHVPLLEARGVGVVSRHWRATRRRLAPTRLEAFAGEVVALVGRNGAGKSTLLDCLAGRAVAGRQGEVLVQGRSLATFSPTALARVRAHVGQQPSADPTSTVAHVVELGRFAHDDGAVTRAAACEYALTRTALTTFRDRRLGELSGGERHRVHVARALAQIAPVGRSPADPRILLLDEPFASLDLTHALTLGEQLRREARDGALVMLVVHDLSLAARLADRVVVLSRGEIVVDTPPPRALTDEILREAFDLDATLESRGGQWMVVPKAARSCPPDPRSTPHTSTARDASPASTQHPSSDSSR